MKTENGGLSQARSKLDDIVRLVRIYGKTQERSDWTRGEMITEAIEEMPLSVEVRTAWEAPWQEDVKPAFFRLLLSTGGPAVQIVGDLDEFSQPESARIEGQDWFQPWEAINLSADETTALVSFASFFCFGEQ